MKTKVATVTKFGMDEWYCMWYICDGCKETTIAPGFKFCPMCGKEINWGNDKEGENK